MPLNPVVRDWRGRRVWVVGASSGIGAALAEALLERGARVALSARSAGPLEALAAPFPPDFRLCLPLDATRRDALAQAEVVIRATWGGLDLAVFCAGTYAPMRAWELDTDKARAMVETNFMSAVHGLQAVLPGFVARGSGGIVIVASVAGYRGLPNGLVYGSTKAALINLAETLYLDLAPRGIGVYLVNPGFVKTPLTNKNTFRMPALIAADEAAAQILKGIERGRFEIHFPRRFTGMLKLGRLLPYSLYFRLARAATGL